MTQEELEIAFKEKQKWENRYREFMDKFGNEFERNWKMKKDVIDTFTRVFGDAGKNQHLKLNCEDLIYLHDSYQDLVSGAMLGETQRMEMIKLAGVLEFLRWQDKLDDDQVEDLCMLMNRLEAEGYR